jgi:DNA mismatch repair protein MutS2
LGAEAVISAIDGADIEVQAGVLRLRLRTEDLRRKVDEEPEEFVSDEAKPSEPKPSQPKPARKGRTRLPTVEMPALELDLRGKRVDDGLDEFQRWLERGFAAGMLFGRVIHGHGTGAMKDAVRAELRQSQFVKRWEPGGEKEGGDGVSVVFFNHQT